MKMITTGFRATADELQAYVDRAYHVRIMQRPVMGVTDDGSFDGLSNNHIRAATIQIPPSEFEKIHDMTDLIKWTVKKFCDDNPDFMYLYSIYDIDEHRYIRFAAHKPKLYKI